MGPKAYQGYGTCENGQGHQLHCVRGPFSLLVCSILEGVRVDEDIPCKSRYAAWTGVGRCWPIPQSEGVPPPTPTPRGPHLQQISASRPLLIFLPLYHPPFIPTPSTPLSRHPILPTRHLLFLTHEKRREGRGVSTISPPHLTLTLTPLSTRQHIFCCRRDRSRNPHPQEPRTATGQDQGIKEEFRPLFYIFSTKGSRNFQFHFPPSTKLLLSCPIRHSTRTTHHTGILRLDDEEFSNLHPLRSLRAA